MHVLRLAFAAAIAAALSGSATQAAAQPAPAAESAAAARPGADRQAAATVRLYPGVAPGSEGWTRVERTTPHPSAGRMIRNVTTPTLEAYLPDPDKATGAGVIVAPGGGMRFLSYDTEGVWVAQWLAEHGVAAFVLKYRTIETPADDKAFAASLAAMFAKLAAAGGKGGAGPLEGAALATADGVRALQVAREHAQEWRVDPNRIGFMGFSAGARVTVGVVSEGGKPAFAAPIYGGAFGETLSLSDAPPMFLAVSGNDSLAGPTELSLFEQLRAARKPVELHVYHTGGHGYGLEPHANSSAHWIDEFYWWLESNGWLKRGR